MSNKLKVRTKYCGYCDSRTGHLESCPDNPKLKVSKCCEWCRCKCDRCSGCRRPVTCPCHAPKKERKIKAWALVIPESEASIVPDVFTFEKQAQLELYRIGQQYGKTWSDRYKIVECEISYKLK